MKIRLNRLRTFGYEITLISKKREREELIEKLIIQSMLPNNKKISNINVYAAVVEAGLSNKKPKELEKPKEPNIEDCCGNGIYIVHYFHINMAVIYITSHLLNTPLSLFNIYL